MSGNPIMTFPIKKRIKILNYSKMGNKIFTYIDQGMLRLLIER